MSENIAIDQLAVLIKAKRGKRGLREIAKEIGDVSPSTLSRIEKGKTPDLDTFLRLCQWLNVSPNQFLRTSTDEVSTDMNSFIPSDMSTPDKIEVHLRADKELDPATAEALANMVRAAYNAVVEGKLGKKKREDQ